ncbi:hypothetical protein HF086_000820 [Spodoptera exigua]|uniref:Saccharopine dehydrogenase n=1 Tax=Spodoptera exigua TaxID=7107 RepID=A0A922MEF5_SPOEX|nr:hypothetical protein HF086_000820 [Spodoptera exigua]
MNMEGTGTWESLVYGERLCLAKDVKLLHYYSTVPRVPLFYFMISSRVNGTIIHYSSAAVLNEMPRLRKALFPEPAPQMKPVVKQKSMTKKNNEWYLEFPGADASVVYRSQQFDYQNEQQRPVQFNAYLKTGSLWQTISLAMRALTVVLMSRSECTRKYLLNNPKYWSGGYVTKEGPTANVTNNVHFTFEMVGKGWPEGADVEKTPPNKTVVAKITGKNPAYGSTVVAVLMCAHTILKERQNMPAPGGVMSSGSAFKNTTLIQKLTDNDLKYEIVSK